MRVWVCSEWKQNPLIGSPESRVWVLGGGGGVVEERGMTGRGIAVL